MNMIKKAQNKAIIAWFLNDAEMWNNAMSEMKIAYKGKK